MTKPFIVQPGEGRLLGLGNFEAVVLADAAEAFYVLEGTYRMHVEDGQDLCGPGSFVYVPANVAHTFVVVSDGPGKKLNLFCPAAMVGFFEELAEAEGNGTATPEHLGEISERNHMGIVGPVPGSYL